MAERITEARVNAAVREWRRVHASGKAVGIHQAMHAALAASEAEASKFREGDRIADAVIAWLVGRGALDADNEYSADDVVAALWGLTA